MKPLIGITTGEIVNKEHPWSPFVYGQSHFYSDAITAAGGIPVLLPFLQDDADAIQLVSQLDGFLFAGGNDVAAEAYGEREIYGKDVSKARDAWELKLLGAAEEAHKPIVAICRGMQLLNVSRGGTLYQDISKQIDGSQNHSASDDAKDVEHLAHTVTIKHHTKLYTMLGVDSIRTNSHHHQAVKKLGDRLTESAHAEDGIIEGLEDAGESFVVAVQSHPESLYIEAEPGWMNLFTALIERAK